MGNLLASSARMTSDDRAKDDVAIAETTQQRGRMEKPHWTGQPSGDDCSHEHGQPPNEVLHVAVAATVDLSRIDTSILTEISSFLGTARELLNLALTCKSFGQPTPATVLNWSLVEEVARQAVCSRATVAEMSCLPQHVIGTTTWLSILHRHEHLLTFDVLLGRYIEYLNGDKTAVCATGDYDGDVSVAVARSYIMRSGPHYVEFLITGTATNIGIGIVRPMPGLDAGAYDEEFDFFDDRFYPDFLAQRSADWVNDNAHACSFASGCGLMSWINWYERELGQSWEGMEACQLGDTVGMLLDLDEGTLSVYRNNRRLGVMKGGLSGAYCWYVDVSPGDAVEIRRVTNLPTALQS
ncbi:hypothetical protein THAOC_24209 [Thalassiosira oceanica]|uniref:B30.2/SPRY domain-containing protein n=1 Tax=Thalassiosira oceanica TaxID=159749 RepID=K0RU91_THAOC|nr:hypothetical protein THAOC_24209 [Thalassiosira oceanica]|eukprot:EJK55984.1 hypothetical protein THAOC_24209 [Thalassiosira oceanica]